MPPLAVIIVWLAVAGMMILIGTARTVRRYFDRQKQRATKNRTQFQDDLSCSYCGEVTDTYTRLILNGVNSIPICFDCQCQMGIRCSDGTISKEYFYQVAECDRI